MRGGGEEGEEGGDGEVERGWGRLFGGREAVGVGEFLGKMGRLFLPFFSSSSCSSSPCLCSSSSSSSTCCCTLSESFLFSYLFSFFSSFPFDGLVSSFRFRMFCAQFGKKQKQNEQNEQQRERNKRGGGGGGGEKRRVGGGGLVERIWEGFQEIGCDGKFGGFCSLVSVEGLLEEGKGEEKKKKRWIWRFSRSNPFQLSLAVSLKERGGGGGGGGGGRRGGEGGKRVVRHYRTSEGCGVREFCEHLERFFESEE